VSDIYLTVGDPEGPGVTFGPLRVRDADRTPSGYDCIEAPIDIRDTTGRWQLDDRNGIEPVALAILRSDLRSLLEARSGRVFFGDHDFSQIVDLAVASPDQVRLVANSASHDVWDIDLGMLTFSDLAAIEAQIDRIEAALGPLTGYCGACGVPQPAYYREA
jgi:hypothetical protein